MRHRPDWLSQGVEVLVEALARNSDDARYDVVIVGSGYGGAVAAARFAAMQDAAGKPLRVCVLERGREYVPGTFPNHFADLPGHVRLTRPDETGAKRQRDGLFDFRIGDDVSALVGNGLGGGSLINAGVAERPHDDVFEDDAWPSALRADREGLQRGYTQAERMLGVRPAETEHIAKYEALRGFASTLGLDARPVQVAATVRDRRSWLGVEQHACIACGGCVTGCNFWAKNTLPMNYLAYAQRAGARLFTGATVSRVTRGDAGWSVHFRQTVASHPHTADDAHLITTQHVVIAAGTYGSTEILLRSREAGLRLSEKLGERFSTNGDMINVHYGYPGRVNSAPREDTPFRERKVGPTITGMFESGRKRAERIVVQELAIPGPLRRVFEEIVTTGAVPVNLSRRDWSAHAPGDEDPAAVDTDAVDCAQVLAAFGDDGAEGRLKLADNWQASHDGAVCVSWENAGDAAVFARQDALLRKSELLGGIYLRNPLWKPLPDDLAGLLSGPQPGGRLFTVHPLGGCPMGEDAASGVVDDLGRVYDPEVPADRTRVHDGLLVLDGSIVPVALGINPLLTITALAERATRKVAALRNWTHRTSPWQHPLPPRPEFARNRLPEPSRTVVRFAERMSGELSLERGADKRRVHLDVRFEDIENVTDFLRRGPHAVPIKTATLRVFASRSETTAAGSAPASAKVSGTVYWMERGRSGMFKRSLRALVAWWRMRGLADIFEELRHAGLFAALRQFRRGGSILSVASNVGELRHLRYALRLDGDLVVDGRTILPAGSEINGLKTFAYCFDGNPWRQLSELAVTIRPAGARAFNAGMLEVDLRHMLRRFAAQFQIVRQRDLPSALMDIASIALFMLRIVFKVHFWSFRAPEYERFDPDRARRRLPQPLEGLRFERQTVRVPPDPEQTAKGIVRDPIVLPLSRYRRPDGRDDHGPVVLFHGFGASGAQYAHPKMPRSLVRHLAEAGFDVWVAELRTSIALPSSWNQWTLDEIAKEDIPAIVDHVLRATGEGGRPRTQLDVIAHCIGSAMFCTAALSGMLHGKIRRAALLQVGPLIELSQGNRFRGHVAAAMRRYMLADHVNSSVDDRADAMNVLLDRVLSTYPYPDSEIAHHRLSPPWKAHTHFANCNRAAGIFGRLIQHGKVAPEMLDALGDLLGQTNLKTFEQTVQYAFYERLTDYDAVNVYVTDDNVRRHFDFPVLFLHGEKNDVFDPQTTARSQKLLKSVFGASHPAERIVLSGYGHLDPLIGRCSEQDVFAPISTFLRRDALQSATAGARRPARHARPPLVGPVLGWTRQENGAWVARIWCRMDDRQSYPAFLMTIVFDAQGNAVPGHARSVPLYYVSNYVTFDIAGRLDLHGIADVPLPAAPGDYEIVVLGAHATMEEEEPAPGDAPSVAAAGSDAPYGAFESMDLMKPWHTSPVDGPAGKREVFVPEPLPKAYVDVIEHTRRQPAAIEQRRDGVGARFPDDPGYETRPDAVQLSGALLRRLGARDAIDFALASCRYPSMMIDRNQADAMFGRLRDLLDGASATPPSLLLLAGDQIYADATAGLFDPKSRRERFYDAYHEAWTAPHAREVLRRLPTYMMMDDHEADDDWHPEDFGPVSSDPARRVPNQMHEWALQAFSEHQLAHSPWKTYVPGESTRLGQDLARPGYWYRFDAAGFPFFVCDTRSTRVGRTHIMSAALHAALEGWLETQQRDAGNRPKFVVSPSVVVPFLKAASRRSAYSQRADGWQGFPQSLQRLFSFIADKGIQNVVFLCGDPHCALTSRLEIDGENGALQALCVIGSPMYAPFPFANAQPEDFELAGSVALAGGGSLRYERLRSVEGNSFTTVGARRNGRGWTIGVRVHGLDGVLDEAEYTLP
jgi:cholesterol oxidase